LSGKTIYDEVVEIWSLERTSKSLVKISEDWIKRLKEYAEELKVRLRLAVDRDSIHSRLCERELEVLSTLVSDIFNVRLEKIVRAAIRGEAVENLLPAESRLYESLLKSLTVYREYIEYCSETLDLTRELTEAVDKVVVEFLKDAPAIVDADGVTRGPFREGSIASLDHRTADLLERGGYVRRLPLIRGASP
jgi:DNA replication initiation complex subunit (GINS family)